MHGGIWIIWHIFNARRLKITDLFEDLLPVTVHHAMSAYEVRKNELVNSEISKLREMTQVLNSVLASLNLPAAIEDLSGTELPQSLLEKAATVRIAGGIKALETAMNDLPDLLQRNKDILDEVFSNRIRYRFNYYKICSKKLNFF